MYIKPVFAYEILECYFDNMNKTLYTKAGKFLLIRLIAARVEARMEQKDAAKKINCTKLYIAKVEKGEEKLDAIQLKELADLYKKDISYFLLPDSKKK
jgi:DNA-binding XRE family transcriptional regulator